MADATTEFFDELSERGHEPLLEKVTGTVRFDLGNAQTDRSLARLDREGRRRGLAEERARRLRRADGRGAVRRHRERTGERDGGAAARRGRRRGRRRAADALPAAVSRAPGSARPALHGGPAGGADERRPRQDPRRQHVRRQRLARATSRRRPTDPTGLFSFDTRFLSTWVLTIDGERLNALSVDDLQYFETRFFLVPGTGTVYVDAKLSVIRHRAVGAGFSRGADDPQPRRQARRPQRPGRGRLRLRRPVRGQGRARRRRARTPHGSRTGRLLLGYQRETFRRATIVSASTPARGRQARA